MYKPLVCAVILAATLAPGAAIATPVVPGTTSLTLAAGAYGEVSASTKGMSISSGSSDCFPATAPSYAHILRVEKSVRSETERGSKMRFELRAQNVGTCTITFHSGKDSATVAVTVRP